MSDNKFVIGPCRLSFPALFEARPVSKGSEKTAFMATLLLEPDYDTSTIVEAIKAAMIERWGKVLKLPARNNPLKKCSEKETYGDEFEDWLYINTKSKFKPEVVDQHIKKVLDKEMLYPGCWVNVQVHAYAYEHDQGGKGVSFGLDMVQFVKDGERLDSKADPSDVFKPVGAPSSDSGGADDSAMDDLFGG